MNKNFLTAMESQQRLAELMSGMNAASTIIQQMPPITWPFENLGIAQMINTTAHITSLINASAVFPQVSMYIHTASQFDKLYRTYYPAQIIDSLTICSKLPKSTQAETIDAAWAAAKQDVEPIGNDLTPAEEENILNTIRDLILKAPLNISKDMAIKFAKWLAILLISGTILHYWNLGLTKYVDSGLRLSFSNLEECYPEEKRQGQHTE